MSADAVPGWCRNILRAAAVRAGEHVRVIVDPPLLLQGEQVAGAARSQGAEVRVLCFPDERPLREPTAELLQSSDWADVSVGLLSQTFSEELTARRAILDRLLARGGRAIAADGIDAETLAGELSEPMPDLERPARELLDAVAGACEIRVRGAAGTDLTLRVDGRPWLDDALPLRAGGVANFPGGEVCVAPLATGADGVLVADLTIPWGPAEGLLPEPVTIRFEHGRARSIEGGAAGERLRRLVEEAGAGADVIAELGIGLNPAVTPRGQVLFDEKVAGTAHVAIGNNTGPYRGDNWAAIHVDCVFSAPELVVDGRSAELPRLGRR